MTENTKKLITPQLYTLIVYTPGEEGWHDRCGDYHRGRDSELKITYYDPEETNLLSMDYGQARFNDSDNEIKLLINGYDAYDLNALLSEEDEKELIYLTEQIEDMANEYYEKLKVAKVKKEEEEKQRKLQEQEMMRIREQRKKEDAEKAELARLQAKYGKQ